MWCSYPRPSRCVVSLCMISVLCQQRAQRNKERREEKRQISFRFKIIKRDGNRWMIYWALLFLSLISVSAISVPVSQLTAAAATVQRRQTGRQRGVKRATIEPSRVSAGMTHGLHPKCAKTMAAFQQQCQLNSHVIGAEWRVWKITRLLQQKLKKMRCATPTFALHLLLAPPTDEWTCSTSPSQNRLFFLETYRKKGRDPQNIIDIVILYFFRVATPVLFVCTSSLRASPCCV